MRLRPLSAEIIRISEQQASTPVLVTPQFLSLRPGFFVEFLATLAELTPRAIRIDWLRDGQGIFRLVSDRIVRIQAKHLQSRLPSPATIQITSAIARPNASDQPLVIGLSKDSQPLPPWTTPIHLSSAATRGESTAGNRLAATT